MSSEEKESPTRLPTGLDSAGIRDFLYVDRARISALYAQLFPQGLLTGVKTTKSQSFTDEGDVGTDLKILRAQSKTVDSGAEGIEHVFDASWAIPLEVLAKLGELNLIRDSLDGAHLGSIVVSSCYLRILDFASMENLWVPAIRAAMAQGEMAEFNSPHALADLAELMKATPRAIHAQFLTNDGFLWSSLVPSGLTVPAHDLTLKFGGTLSGMWRVLFILDAWPEVEDNKLESWGAGELMDGVLFAMHNLRKMMGKPATWLGITPLMVYRTFPGGDQTPLNFSGT